MLIIREMQIKTTMRYHLTPARMATIDKSTNNEFWWGWTKGNPTVLLVEMLTDVANEENSMEFPSKIKN